MVVVLDASVVLAAVLGEAGHERLFALNEMPFVSTVNMAEARARLSDHGMSDATIEDVLSLVSKVVVDFTDADAIASAALRDKTRAAGLSLGDRACLALARRLNATALTADRQWATLQLPINVELLR
jgi:PIN domain nuclease of toxin-antitoxin system